MESGQRLIKAVAVILFLTVCAYAGSALRHLLGGDMVSSFQVQQDTVCEALELDGIAVRDERLLRSSGGRPAVRDGKRLPAGAVILRENGADISCPCSAVFFEAFDGFEYLTPDKLKNLTVSSLNDILVRTPENTGGVCGRLVCSGSWYFAALCPDTDRLSADMSCSVIFDGQERSVPGRIAGISAPQDGKRAVLLRLTDGDSELLSLRRCKAQIIFSRYTGLRLPEAAVKQDEEGNYFVYTVTASVVEQKTVDIIYREPDGEWCLAASEASADALREGNTVITSGKDIYEGKVLT